MSYLGHYTKIIIEEFEQKSEHITKNNYKQAQKRKQTTFQWAFMKVKNLLKYVVSSDHIYAK